MVVRNKAHPIAKLREILENQKGIILTSDLTKYGIPRLYLSVLEKHGEIQRISRGIYTASNSIMDEMAILQIKYKKTAFSRETALYLHDLTDRTPLFYTVTVPDGYNATSLKAEGIKVFFVNSNLYPLGLITMKSSHGNDVKTFDLERTICDLLRSRKLVDVQFINDAMKMYVIKKSRNFDLLYWYAKNFRIEKIVRQYIEILL